MDDEIELRNYGEELSKVFQNENTTDEDIEKILKIIKEMVDEQIKLEIPTIPLNKDDEEILTKGLKKLSKEDIKYYIEIFKICGFASNHILMLIWQLIHATRNIG